MSSPRGLEEGGMGGMGTEELRLDGLLGEGDLRRDGEGRGEGVEGAVRGNRNEKGLNGSFERKGGCRTFKYMLKFRNALFA